MFLPSGKRPSDHTAIANSREGMFGMCHESAAFTALLSSVSTCNNATTTDTTWVSTLLVVREKGHKKGSASP